MCIVILFAYNNAAYFTTYLSFRAKSGEDAVLKTASQVKSNRQSKKLTPEIHVCIFIWDFLYAILYKIHKHVCR